MDKSVMTVMQGDQYYIPFAITLEDGTVADAELFDDVEITIGGLRKSISRGEIEYSPSLEVFQFPLTQAESFKMLPAAHALQIRLKPKGSADVIGISLGEVTVIKSESKAVL